MKLILLSVALFSISTQTVLAIGTDLQSQTDPCFPYGKSSSEIASIYEKGLMQNVHKAMGHKRNDLNSAMNPELKNQSNVEIEQWIEFHKTYQNSKPTGKTVKEKLKPSQAFKRSLSSSTYNYFLFVEHSPTIYEYGYEDSVNLTQLNPELESISCRIDQLYQTYVSHFPEGEKPGYKSFFDFMYQIRHQNQDITNIEYTDLLDLLADPEFRAMGNTQ